MIKMISVFVVAFCAAHAVHSASPASAQEVPAADSQTTAIVDAASAFLATLGDEQKKAVLFAFTDSKQRVRWSNFPDGAVERSGLRWGDLETRQRTALIDLLGTILSPEGVTMVEHQMAADDVLAAGSTGGGGNGRPPVNFGSDYYYVSFVGTPSATTPWMLQFGGHHLAINATVVGPNVTLSPTLTGGEPLKFTKDGKDIHITENEVAEAVAMLSSLTEEQLGTAVIGNEPINLVLGPGKDGMILPPEGLPGSAMSDAQRAQLLKLIEARLSIMNADDLAATMATVRKTLDQTYFAWWGPTTPGGAAYFRLTGPSVLIEFSPEDNDGDATNHAHNIYRDPTNEYGAAWTSLE